MSVAVPAVAADQPDFAAFLVGMVALRLRAQNHFGARRGNEWLAEFPYVGYRYWEDDRLVLINRRGVDASGAAVPREEIEYLLSRLQEYGVSESRFANARAEVLSSLAGPSARSITTPVMTQRARQLAMATCRGWPADLRQRIEKVTVADASAVMKRVFAPARRRWFVLNPTAETIDWLRKTRRLGRRRGNSGQSRIPVQSKEANGRRMP